MSYDSRFGAFPVQNWVLADNSKWITETSEYNYDFAFGQKKIIKEIIKSKYIKDKTERSKRREYEGAKRN